MKAFAALYSELDETTKTLGKVAAMARYFAVAPPVDAAWAVHFLTGRRPKRLVSSAKMHGWAAEVAGLPTWLFGECYDAVGDLAETIAAILPEGHGSDLGLNYWVIDRLLPLGGLEEAEQKAALVACWAELTRPEMFVWNKLITGSFRVGVSSELVTRALSEASGVPAPTISHRLMGDWKPTSEFYEGLFTEASPETDLSRPYPFCLAHPIENGPEGLGEPDDWQVEWKWDGIRAQVIRREGKSFVWSRGEELITDRFPEILGIAESLPNGTVLDGEILAWAQGKPLKFMELQKRIGRKILSKKILQEVPVVLVAFDLLELEGRDLRELSLRERRSALEGLVESVNRVEGRGWDELMGLPKRRTDVTAVDTRLARESALSSDPEGVLEDSRGSQTPGEPPTHPTPKGSHPTAGDHVVLAESRLLIASRLPVPNWEALAVQREDARALNVEGFMIKRLDSAYQTGRRKGHWWKWKVDPLTVDAVLVYAQRGSGKRASLYSDYTFAVWDEEGKLVPFAKAYSGLTDGELAQVDRWVRAHTKEKFGPVRTVEPQLVMELAFEGIQISSRHKSGIAVRFPRILRWRHDKKPADADSLASVRELLSTDTP